MPLHFLEFALIAIVFQQCSVWVPLLAMMSQTKRPQMFREAHPEAVAGAIAVALATAHAVRSREGSPVPDWRTFIDAVLLHVPASEVRDTVQMAWDLTDDLTIEEVCARIGNGAPASPLRIPYPSSCVYIATGNGNKFP